MTYQLPKLSSVTSWLPPEFTVVSYWTGVLGSIEVVLTADLSTATATKRLRSAAPRGWTITRLATAGG